MMKQPVFLTHLRPARTDDCHDICVVHRYAVEYACRNHYNDTILQAWTALLHPEAYLEAMKDRILWVIEYKNHIQGFFQLDLATAELDALYVHPFVHRIGLGTAMLGKAEEIASEANLSYLKLYASLNSVSFYLLNDYRRLGECALQLSASVRIKGELMRKFLHTC